MMVLPYKRFDVNVLAIASNLILTCSLITALLIKLYDDFSFSWTTEGTSRVLRIHNRFGGTDGDLLFCIPLCGALCSLENDEIHRRVGKATFDSN
mmetsp:Transcript_78065/g.233963  ORF Transcript_78065/g.233963 Transcript_78065/m.233963 type:complete len:95 (+) Transcript_78065:223-507(+)